jgi:hypothetical protein
MKAFRSTGLLLLLAALLGGWIWFRERDPVAPDGNEILWTFNAASVNNIELQNGERKLTLTRKGEAWTVTGNSNNAVPADTTQIESLLQQIRQVQSDTVIPASTNRAEYGLQSPQSTLIVDGRTLQFGIKSPFDPSRIYAQSDNKIALLPAALQSWTTKSLDEWRDKAVLRFAPEPVSEFSINAPSLKATFAKDVQRSSETEHFWRVAQPVNMRADAAAIQSFLSALSTAQTTKFLDDSPTQWQLDKPTATLQIDSETSLHIGKKVEGGYAAQSSKNASVFLLSDATFGLLNRPLRDWLAKTVLPFNLNDVSSLRVEARGKTLEFAGNGIRWQPTNGAYNEAVSHAVTDLLLAAQSLNASEVLLDKSPASAKYGLDKPLLHLVLKTKQGDLQLRLSRKNNRIYAASQIGAEPMQFFSLPPDALETFNKKVKVLFPEKHSPGTKSDKLKNTS